ncbi:MAG: DUF4358 domain-containing protein [Huintestinicola sp.]
MKKKFTAYTAAAAVLIAAACFTACGASEDDTEESVPIAAVITTPTSAAEADETEAAEQTDAVQGEETEEVTEAALAKSCGDIAEAVLEQVDMSSMAEIGADRLSNYLNLSDVPEGSFSMYICGSGGFADEIAVFDITVNDEAAVRDAVDSRIASRKKDFADYNPDEYDKLSEALVETKGKYLIFAVSSDNNKVMDIFSSLAE